MTSDPLTVSSDVEVPRVLRQMNEAGARHVPVIEDDRVVGMITLDDLVTLLAGESECIENCARRPRWPRGVRTSAWAVKRWSDEHCRVTAEVLRECAESCRNMMTA